MGRYRRLELKLPADALILAVSCPIADVAQVLDVAVRAAADRRLQLACIGRVGTGSFVMGLVAEDGNNQQMSSAVHAIRAALPSRVTVSVRRCPDDMRSALSPWQLRSDELEIMRTLKNALDPAWILNRGRYFV